MNIQSLDRATLEKIYNVYYRDLFEYLGCKDFPARGMIGYLAPSEESEPHRHHEKEIFFILNGTGLYKGDSGERLRISQGSIQVAPAFGTHSLVNTGDDELIFISIWWDTKSIRDIPEKISEINKLPENVILVATPPTPNGDLHLGHISGPYLAGDVLKRFLKMNCVSVNYFTGIDINQSYVPLEAEKSNCTPRDIYRKYRDRILTTFKSANIDFDYILDPDTEDNYATFIRIFFRRLYDKGILVAKERDAFFTKDTGEYLFEAYITGLCPHCGNNSDGNACECCGFFNQCTDLGSPKRQNRDCVLIKKRIKQLYLPVDQYKALLGEFLTKCNMSSHMKRLCTDMCESGLSDIALTHPTNWGIKSDIEGFEDQVYYVWAEMAAAYLYIMQELEVGVGEKYTLTSRGDVEYIHCFGYDNGPFYSILFPVLWIAHGEDTKLADRFITNEHLCLNNLKFSTSRRHAIWAKDFFKQYDADIVRFYLASISPESYQTNFKLVDFYSCSIELWKSRLSELVKSTSSQLIASGLRGIPEAGAWSDEQISYYDILCSFILEIDKAFNPKSFSLNRAAKVILLFLDNAIAFSKSQFHFLENSALNNNLRTSIQLQMTTFLYLAYGLYPLMPKFSEDLWRSLGLNGIPEKLTVESIQLEVKEFKGFPCDYFEYNTKRLEESLKYTMTDSDIVRDIG